MHRNLRTFVRGLMRPTSAFVVVVALAAAFTGGALTCAQEATDFAAGDAVVVNTDSLQLRADSGLAADVVTTLPDGTFATVTDGPVVVDDYTWYALDVDGTSGWAAGEFLAFAADAGGLPVGTLVTAISDGVNLRDASGLDGGVVATLDSGAVATVAGGPESVDGYDWYQVDADGTSGWIARDFVAFAPSDGAFAAGETALINTDSLSLRDAAGLDSGVLDTLAGGAIVTIVSGPTDVDGYVWYEVSTDLGDGFVAGEFLQAA